MADELPPLFGRSAFDRRHDQFDALRHALFGMDNTRENAEWRRRTPAPFRIGQAVRQISGPGVGANLHCIVEDIKFLENVSGFTGWAIKLQGRAKPYQASMFQAISEPTTAASDPFGEVGPGHMPEVRVFYDSMTRTYRAVIDDLTLAFTKTEIETSLPRTIRDSILDRAPHLPVVDASRIAVKLIHAASTPEARADRTAVLEANPAPPVNGKRRRIIRPGEQG